MWIKMLSTRKGKEEGRPVKTFAEGESYNIEDDSLLDVFIDNRWCDLADDDEPEEKARGVSPENKMMAESEEDENKDEEIDIQELSIAQLRKYAAEKGIDLGKATRKDDILMACELDE